MSNVVLSIFGLRLEEDKNVSEDMVRMVVAEAQRTEGIEKNEGRMIEAVLNMDTREVEKIMQPRVDIVALPFGNRLKNSFLRRFFLLLFYFFGFSNSKDASGNDILQAAVSTKYSRIPVYKKDIDNIIGVLFTKDLLNYMDIAELVKTGAASTEALPRIKDSWRSLNASQLMEPTFFVPEKMSTWDALQAMRKRRVHMAIVVDEYGGTSGLVSFEVSIVILYKYH